MDFSEWLITYSAEINLSFHKRVWLRTPPGLPPFIFQADITYNGKSLFGLGNSHSSKAGHIIAAAEVLERVGMIHLGLRNSNGCAVHTTLDKARAGAKNELLERDAFLCHFHSQTPVSELPPECHGRLEEIKFYTKAYGWDFDAGILQMADGSPCVLVGVNGLSLPRPQGLFLGLGTGADYLSSLEKALPECLRFFDTQIRELNSIKSITLEEFKSLSKKGVSEHTRLGLDPEYGSKVWNILFANKSKTPKSQNYTYDIAYQDLELKEILVECPLIFTHASSKQLNNLSFGEYWKEGINEERIRSFSGKADIFCEPHTLG